VYERNFFEHKSPVRNKINVAQFEIEFAYPNPAAPKEGKTNQPNINGYPIAKVNAVLTPTMAVTRKGFFTLKKSC
jgi:hypothetical protein